MPNIGCPNAIVARTMPFQAATFWAICWATWWSDFIYLYKSTSQWAAFVISLLLLSMIEFRIFTCHLMLRMWIEFCNFLISATIRIWWRARLHRFNRHFNTVIVWSLMCLSLYVHCISFSVFLLIFIPVFFSFFLFFPFVFLFSQRISSLSVDDCKCAPKKLRMILFS